MSFGVKICIGIGPEVIVGMWHGYRPTQQSTAVTQYAYIYMCARVNVIVVHVYLEKPIGLRLLFHVVK